jgi:hypothetical protein
VASTSRFRVLLVSSDGFFVDGHHEYRGDGLPDVGDTIDVVATPDRTHAIRARVTHITAEHNLPIAATQLDA